MRNIATESPTVAFKSEYGAGEEKGSGSIEEDVHHRGAGVCGGTDGKAHLKKIMESKKEYGSDQHPAGTLISAICTFLYEIRHYYYRR